MSAINLMSTTRMSTQKPYKMSTKQNVASEVIQTLEMTLTRP